ncbi:hypothetical protein HK414_26160 [Ramlibacter terrae]|uniref:Uncharacterized protein n=1 Tax=Ramlibacter terrae TaxID=2732511 RepID=A0ABX6P5Z6_9BURK|nr:hypothetical protein HK414_26160 [Ramlibacter terrae]
MIASVAPPASSGEISLTGRVGRKADCASAGSGKAAVAASAAMAPSSERRSGTKVADMASPVDLY